MKNIGRIIDMEHVSQPSKESGVSRVVGFGDKKEAEFLDYFKHKFENNHLDIGEKQKTAEEMVMIGRVNKCMADFLAEYDAKAIEIPVRNVHVIDKTKFSKDELERMYKSMGTNNGYYSSPDQGVAILKDYDESKLSYLQTLVHEMLHIQAFYSYQKSSKEAADLSLKKDDQSASMNIRRSGFSIGTKDGKKRLFNKLDESVITELTIRFEKKYLEKWRELQGDIQKRDKYIRHTAEKDQTPIERLRETVASVKVNSPSEYTMVSHSYHIDRDQFNCLVDELYKRNETDFESREDVFELFAKATLTGRLLPVARLVEQTFGKGSFREIGEASADKVDKK